jgi:hypothetical protein
MPAEEDRLTCPTCGKPIGTYEPLWRVHPWTGAERTSRVHLAKGPRSALKRIWHADCAETAGIDGG